MKNNTNKYAAFISYRHIEPDMAIATRLHRLLESYHIPNSVKKITGVKKIGHIFRDQDELPLSRNLGDDIKNALDSSEWLIVIASPEYLKSYWCNEELNHFIETGKKDRILVVLASGDQKSSFPEEICFNERDGKKVPIEPLAADVRAKDISSSLKKLKQEKLRILAPVLGVSYDELRRRDRERKLINLLKIGTSVLVLVSVFAIYAVRQSRIIETQRRIAAENEVQLLTEKAITLVQNNDRIQARQYAMQAYEVSASINGAFADQALNALSAACYSGDFTQIRALDANGLTIRNMLFSPDDSLISGIAENDMIVCFNAENGNMLFSQPGVDGEWDSLSFSSDSHKLIALNKANNRICILSSETGEVLQILSSGDDVPAFSVNHASFLKDGKIWILDQEGSTVVDTESANSVNAYQFAKQYPYFSPIVCKNADKAVLFTGDGTGQAELVSPYVNAGTILDTGMLNIKTGCFSQDGKGLVLTDYSGQTALFDTETLDVIWMNEPVSEQPVCISVTPDDQFALIVYHDHLEALNMTNGNKEYTVSENAKYDTGKIMYTGDGSYWFTDLYPHALYRTIDGKCYAETDEILSADHKGTVLVMNNRGVLGKNNMVGQGSVRKVSEYEGILLDISSWNPMKRESVLNNPWNDTGNGMNPLQQRMYVSPDGRFVILANDGSYMKIWDLDQSDDVVYRCYQHTIGGNTMINDLAFSLDSRLMATAGYNGCCTLFDLENGKILRILNISQNQSQLGKVKFNQNGDLVMITDSIFSQAWIYSVRDGTELYHLYAGDCIEDFGFDTDSGNGVLLYTDGSAQIATIFSDPSVLLSYAAALEAIPDRTE